MSTEIWLVCISYGGVVICSQLPRAVSKASDAVGTTVSIGKMRVSVGKMSGVATQGDIQLATDTDFCAFRFTFIGYFTLVRFYV